MTLLGHLSLWLAFLVGLWGAITGFVGGAQGRADLQQSARHATFALFAALVTCWIVVPLCALKLETNASCPVIASPISQMIMPSQTTAKL